MYDHSMPVITEGLQQIYYPNKVVLDEIDLTVVGGETIGILGNNGAGKTTLLRILATLLYPSSGTIKIFGKDPRQEANEIKPLIGYLPERFSFYPHYSVIEVIDFFEHLISIKRIDQVLIREEVIKLLEIEPYLEYKIQNLSKGMLHKVGLAITLIHDPPLLLLDEPTSGLDPLVRNQVRKILVNLREDFDKTILISSHILEDVEAVCDRVFFLEAGRMIHEPFWISDLKDEFTNIQRLDITHEKVSDFVIQLTEQGNVLYCDPNPRGVSIYCKKSGIKKICQFLEEILHGNLEMHPKQISLEDIYLLNHVGVEWASFFA